MIKATQIISVIDEAQEPYLILGGPNFVQRIAKNLHEFLPYVKVYNASRGDIGLNAGDTHTTLSKRAITTPGDEVATGIEVYFDIKNETVQFAEITSKKPGAGTKMVSAVISEVPKTWLLSIHHDWSGGFWESMKRKFSDWKWNLENSFSSDHSDNIYQLWGDRDRGIIELRVIDISGKTQSRRQFEKPFRSPADFHDTEDEIKKEVSQTDQYEIGKEWREVPFKSMY
jgi:hypothetical protein